MNRLRLGAETADHVVFLSQTRMMIDGITIYRVNEVTFAATGPIPPACIQGVYQSVIGGYKSVYVPSFETRPDRGREVPTRGPRREKCRAQRC